MGIYLRNVKAGQSMQSTLQDHIFLQIYTCVIMRLQGHSRHMLTNYIHGENGQIWKWCRTCQSFQTHAEAGGP